jgi:hypothetical protein
MVVTFGSLMSAVIVVQIRECTGKQEGSLCCDSGCMCRPGLCPRACTETSGPHVRPCALVSALLLPPTFRP